MTMTASKPGYDGHEPEFMPARDIESRDRMTGKIVRETPDGPQNVNHNRITMMLAGKRLEPRQAEAAGNYYRDWHDSERLVLASAALVRVDGSGRACSTVNDHKLDAGKCRKQAEMSLKPRFRPIIWKVVIEGKLMEVAASELHIHHQRAAERLEIGLDLLADHYRIAE